MSRSWIGSGKLFLGFWPRSLSENPRRLLDIVCRKMVEDGNWKPRLIGSQKVHSWLFAPLKSEKRGFRFPYKSMTLINGH